MLKPKVQPPICWIGGKSRLAERIIAKMSEHKTYVEVFGGAGWVLFRKPPVMGKGKYGEVYNDLDSELVNLFKVIKENYANFIREFRLALVSRQIWNEYRLADPTKMSPARRAARFWYMVNASFAGRRESFPVRTASPAKPNLERMPEIIKAVHKGLVRVNIEHLDFRELIPRYDRPATCFYLDPPYLGCPDYRHNMGKEDFLELREILSRLKGKFLLSLNDHNWIRNAFAEFKIETVITKYTCAKKISCRKQVTELLIRNY